MQVIQPDQSTAMLEAIWWMGFSAGRQHERHGDTPAETTREWVLENSKIAEQDIENETLHEACHRDIHIALQVASLPPELLDTMHRVFQSMSGESSGT